MKAENNKMVAVDYTLTVDGKIADRSRPGQPLEFIFGTGMLLPKFEAAIVGKEPGEKVSFTLAPADGYGEIGRRRDRRPPQNDIHGRRQAGRGHSLRGQPDSDGQRTGPAYAWAW